MTDTTLPKNAAALQRLRLIDFLFDHYGAVKRRFIMDYFGISMPQASMDLNAYIAVAPDNIVYDKTLRAYRRTADFQRRFP